MGYDGVLQVDDSVLELAHFPPNVRGILWETWSLDKVKLILLSVRRERD